MTSSAQVSFTVSRLSPFQTEYYGEIWVDVWQGCNPEIVNGNDPLYCKAKISPTPDGAPPGQECHWDVVTTMPIEGTNFNWYVNDVWKASGPGFDYTHPSSGGFTIYMTAENLTFGARNDSKWIPVDPQLSCYS
jgi:hypothetical protein